MFACGCVSRCCSLRSGTNLHFGPLAPAALRLSNHLHTEEMSGWLAITRADLIFAALSMRSRISVLRRLISAPRPTVPGLTERWTAFNNPLIKRMAGSVARQLGKQDISIVLDLQQRLEQRLKLRVHRRTATWQSDAQNRRHSRTESCCARRRC